MINNVTLSNFKCIEQASIDLRAFTLLAGPNGCGKTAVMEAIHLIATLWFKTCGEVFTGLRSVEALRRHVDNAAPIKIIITGTSGQRRNQRYLKLEEADDKLLISVNGSQSEPSPTHPLRVEWSGVDDADWPELYRSVLFHLEPNRVPSFSEADRDARVKHDGSNVATVLANLRLVDDDRFGWIVEDLRHVFPWVQRVKAMPSNGHEPRDGRGDRGDRGDRGGERGNRGERRDRTKTSDGDGGDGGGFQLMFDTTGGTGIPGYAIGKGVLVVLALLTAINAMVPPRLALVDDLDKYLDPDAFARFAQLLQEETDERAKERFPIQIIGTAHSVPSDVFAVKMGKQ